MGRATTYLSLRVCVVGSWPSLVALIIRISLNLECTDGQVDLWLRWSKYHKNSFLYGDAHIFEIKLIYWCLMQILAHLRRRFQEGFCLISGRRRPYQYQIGWPRRHSVCCIYTATAKIRSEKKGGFAWKSVLNLVTMATKIFYRLLIKTPQCLFSSLTSWSTQMAFVA